MSPFSQLTGRRMGSVWPMASSVSGEKVSGLVLLPATGCVSLFPLESEGLGGFCPR